MRKLLAGAAVVLALGAVSAVSAYDMSIGLGNFWGSDFAGGIRTEEKAYDPPVKWDLAMPHSGWGGYLFFDALYGEVSVSSYLGSGTREFRYTDGIVPLNDSVDRQVSLSGLIPREYSFTALNIAVAGKYPVRLNEKNVMYALLGVEYSIVLQGKSKYYDRIPDSVVVQNWGGGNGEWSRNHFNALWIKFGGGMYYNLTERVYLRPEVQYGFRLANEYEKSNVKTLRLEDVKRGDQDDYDRKTALGHGFTVKLGIGYRFYIAN
jgi:opacity protein-like surface antigen